jgi:hypothetical protein
MFKRTTSKFTAVKRLMWDNEGEEADLREQVKQNIPPTKTGVRDDDTL